MKFAPRPLIVLVLAALAWMGFRVMGGDQAEGWRPLLNGGEVRVNKVSAGQIHNFTVKERVSLGSRMIAAIRQRSWAELEK